MDAERTFGTLFIGFIFSTILYGLTSFQAYVYFTRYSKDLVPLKLLTSTLWALDTASTGLLAHAMYVYLVRDFGLSIENVNATTTFCTSNAVTAIVILLVQAYYIWRAWTVSNGSRLVYIAVLSAILTFGFGLASTILLFQNRNVADFVKSTNLGLSLAYASCGTICTTFICFALLRYLAPRRELATSHLESVVAYTLNRPVLIVSFQIAYLISTIIQPSKLYQLPFLLVLGKVYINVLLAALNYRAVKNDRGINEEESQPSSSTGRAEKNSDIRYEVQQRESGGLIAELPKQRRSDMLGSHGIGLKRDRQATDKDPVHRMHENS